ncbi:hypothetical protein ACFU1R_06475 [Priestia megaterium]|uniref:hypothetical protein n=1 Tax=Priestia megaterium TaxID=1404 RepID=UPI0036710E4C
MGEMADLCWEAALQEACAINNTIDELTKTVSNQQVINDIIDSFSDRPVDEYDSSECLARDILITVAKRKTLSSKQKKCLVRVLVERSDDGYETDWSY